MIESIKYRLTMYKKYKFLILTILLTIILMLEIYASYSLTSMENKVEVDASYKNIREEPKLIEIVEELSNNNLNILNIEKNDKSYNFEVEVKGCKNEIYNLFKELKNYNIIQYEFGINLDYIEGKAILSYN